MIINALDILNRSVIIHVVTVTSKLIYSIIITPSYSLSLPFFLLYLEINGAFDKNVSICLFLYVVLYT